MAMVGQAGLGVCTLLGSPEATGPGHHDRVGGFGGLPEQRGCRGPSVKCRAAHLVGLLQVLGCMRDLHLVLFLSGGDAGMDCQTLNKFYYYLSNTN